MSGGPIELQIVRAVAADAAECVRVRGMTRENAVSEERLRAHGITTESWAEDIRNGLLPGWVARRGQQLVGYCFGAAKTGEVVVLALLPQEEGLGLGKRLLQLVTEDLASQGHTRLFLGCASDPGVRSYGFYRHLGWQSTGTTDQHGDEVLQLQAENARVRKGEA
jgi:GNAT superfamily N-acetyltransferase